jgi:hypothetical protein
VLAGPRGNCARRTLVNRFPASPANAGQTEQDGRSASRSRRLEADGKLARVATSAGCVEMPSLWAEGGRRSPELGTLAFAGRPGRVPLLPQLGPCQAGHA